MMAKTTTMPVLAAATLALFTALPAAANCTPPWQTLFACNIPERDARAEFCKIADTKAHPGMKEVYYNYVVGTKPSQLYFQAEGYIFSTKDTDVNHPTDLTMAIGFPNGKHVYAFSVTEDSRLAGGYRDAQVRVYSSIDAFTSSEKDTELIKLYCDSSSIIADRNEIRP